MGVIVYYPPAHDELGSSNCMDFIKTRKKFFLTESFKRLHYKFYHMD